MPTPDEAAAAEPQRVLLHELAREHVGAVITFQGVTGELDAAPVPSTVGDGLLSLAIQEPGKPFLAAFTGQPDEPVEIVHAAPPSPYDDEANAEAQTPEHILIGRELAQINDAITAHEGEIEGLKKRKAELDAEIMKYFELAGDTALLVDGRRVYLKPRSFPQYKDRPESEGGGRYGSNDAVKVLRAIGRVGNIKPESVLPQTMGAILREYRDGEDPMPPELAAIVELGEEYSVKVGAPRSKRR
jgi:hypothetical protein